MMKALSIKQPWLYCITDLDKRVENRTWDPPRGVIRTRIALHASKKKDDIWRASEIAGFKLQASNMPVGAIVATAIVRGWCHSQRRGKLDGCQLKWFVGPYGWILEDVRKLARPVECRGYLKLWDVPEDVVRQMKGEGRIAPSGQLSLF